jgi:hypothetical protein
VEAEAVRSFPLHQAVTLPEITVAQAVEAVRQETEVVLQAVQVTHHRPHHPKETMAVLVVLALDHRFAVEAVEVLAQLEQALRLQALAVLDQHHQSPALQ